MECGIIAIACLARSYSVHPPYEAKTVTFQEIKWRWTLYGVLITVG